LLLCLKYSELAVGTHVGVCPARIATGMPLLL
jgi:hypothetical protein